MHVFYSKKAINIDGWKYRHFMCECKVVLRNKCRYLESFLIGILPIQTEYEDLLCKSPYSVWVQGSADPKSPNTDTFYGLLKFEFTRFKF